MKEIVPHPGVRHWRLGGDCLYRRMGIDARHGSQPAGIGDAKHTSPSVVPGHIPEQPLDSVIGISRLIDALRIPSIAQRMIHDELALAAKPSADILIDEDVLLSGEKPVVR